VKLNGHAGTAGSDTNRLRNHHAQNRCDKIAALLVLALIILFTNGCALGGKNATPTDASATFQLAPATVNFGSVPIGKQLAQTVTVINPGKNAVHITEATLSSKQFVLTGAAMPMAVLPGTTKTFSVGVNPGLSGNLTGTLTVKGDAGSSPVIVNLSATGIPNQPKILLSTNTVDFGTVGVGSQGTANVVVSNAGGSDLTLSVININGLTFAETGVSTPKTIAAGQAAALSVSFRPTAAGSELGSIVISSNDPSQPAATISLTGTGSAAPVPQLSANTSSLTFNNVASGASATQQVTLSNTGNGPAQISAISVAGAGFSVSGVSAPSTLNASQTEPLTVKFNPVTTGPCSGTLTVVSNANGSPLKIALSGTGVQAGLSVAPSSFDFGSVVDGQTKSQAVSLTNTGSAPLTIAQVAVSGSGYSAMGLSTPTTLAPGNSTSFNVVFSPATAGSLNGLLSISSNAPNSPASASFKGTGVAASATMIPSPASVSFGSISAGSSSTQNVTLTNTGNSNLTISQISANAKDVQVSGITTPLTLAAGSSASMTLTFNPHASETVAGSVNISSTQGVSAVVPLTGSAVQPALSITPSTVNFGSLSVASTNSQTIQVSNSGTGTLIISQIGVTGSGFASSSLSLPIVLNGGQSSTFNLQFTPGSAGSASGSASIISNAPNSPAAIALSGTGIASSQTLSFSSKSLSFGSVSDGSSAAQSVTVSNSGNSNVVISQISLSGAAYSLSGAATPVTLTPTQSLTLGVLFAPATAGAANGSITVVSNATGSPAIISLSGTGVGNVTHSVSLSWSESSSGVTGYNVYRSTTSGSGYIRVNGALVTAQTFTDSPVQGGTTYYYVTTALDGSGNESGHSNEAQAIVP
jgi:Abnormal spindle-like microcephaly-assoc'd, ASPM-SPD-2-Hydin/Protein of unknown function (DUF1573)